MVCDSGGVVCGGSSGVGCLSLSHLATAILSHYVIVGLDPIISAQFVIVGVDPTICCKKEIPASSAGMTQEARSENAY